MSRIDEAVRRAAELARQQGTSSIHQPVASVDGDEVSIATLAREPFPSESADPIEQPEPGPAPAPPEPREPARTVMPLAALRGSQPTPITPAKPAAFSLPEKFVTDPTMPTVSREQYRRLAGALHHAQGVNGLKVVMVASAVQGEGKTLTASNLALTFSEGYRRRVLLIDADLRRPTVHTLFNVPNSSGLSELTSGEGARLFAHDVSPRLAVLPAGPPTGDPMAGLTSSRMRRVVEEARESFDWVIVDTPPVVLLSDANLLSEMVDGAVLVVKAGSTPYDLVARAIAALGRERVLGVVLNHSEATSTRHADYYEYYGNVNQAAV